ncbi:MAG: amino acid ABC transporter substrate-binding protein [Nitrospina sp.]|nr:MAG: amino acid ABC transporter substrate-binding protein [Nitrospina sp.]
MWMVALWSGVLGYLMKGLIMSRSRVKGFGWLFLLFLSGNFLVSNAYAETDVIKDILKRGELRVAVQSQGPPMSFIDKKGQRAGFVIDVISMMAQDMSVELKILDYDWKGLIPAVLSKKADFLAADMTPTPKRALVLNFTDPYTFVDIVLYSKTSAPFKKWQDACDKKFTIGVVQGSSNVGVLRKKCGAAKIKEFSGGAAAVAVAINTKRVDAGITVRNEAESTVEDFANLHILAGAITRDPLCFATRSNEWHLLQWMNNYFTFIRADGRLDRLIDYWMSGTSWKQDH